MTIKLMVFYPQPLDVERFETEYTQHHLVLMRELLGPSVPLPTYKVVSQPHNLSPFYRVAEIHFRDQHHFDEFIASGKAHTGRESSVKVSSGGKPTFLICHEQPAV